MIKKLILVILLFFMIAQGASADWTSNSSIVTGLAVADNAQSPEIFNDAGTWKLIMGLDDGLFLGYYWSGSTWVSDSSIVNGLSDVGSYSIPTIFYDAGTWKLISGDGFGTFTGFYWNGTGWEIDSSIVNGLGDIGDESAPTVFYDAGTWKLIAGEMNGVFYGYHWNGTGWQTNSSVKNGLSDIGWSLVPNVFNDAGTWKLISGNGDGTFYGYYWSGSIWVSDSSIITGLGDIGWLSKQGIFNDSGVWKLIAGEMGANLYGYELLIPTYNVSGNVTSSDGSIAGAIVTLVGVGSDTTNATGYYSISDVPSNTYTITVTATDYNDYSDTITISGDTTKDIAMTSDSITPVVSAISNFISPPPSPPSPTVHAIEKITIKSVINDIATYISTSSNWIVLLFAYIGALLGVLLLMNSTIESISVIVNTLLGGTIAWMLVLSINFGVLQLITGNQIIDLVMLGIVGIITGIVLTHFSNSEGRI